MAAEQGDARAQFSLGVMYDDGEGVSQHYAEAQRWYRKAAEQGHVGAQVRLGSMYAIGKGVPASNVAAHMWYNIAGANGNGPARESRDATAEEMTPKEITEAQRRAQVCMSSGYADCD
jgi:TPR repeat protein